MAVLKCSVCGGEMEVNEDLSIGVCKFCDSTNVIPKNLDKKGNLYNRAIFHRQNREFDKAVSTYEDILKEDNSDAEAHWGLVLSKYGIEYVSDPRTGQHIPTCHRTQAASILSDPDYLAALEFADVESQRVIETEAKRISEIQARILEISRKEPPYDIFICYKESDEAGNRTEDSTLAQELYYELVKKNYKVFFARKTLASKLGTEYEPIIYAALDSAKVMIVLGTRAENFNAVWVRNEWNRFLKMSEGSQKTIIPAYRGMSPAELPIELSGLQAQDMSRIGFMQDLTDGIERCLHANDPKSEIKPNVDWGIPVTQISEERLLQNGETYLKLNNYSEAEDVYKRMTKEYPENHRGWWGLIVCQTRNFSNVILDQSSLNKWFGYVKQLASPSDFSELKTQYVQYTKKVAESTAEDDIEKVKQTINRNNTQIAQLCQDIDDLKDRIAKTNDSIIESQRQQKLCSETDQNDIERMRELLRKAENKRSGYKAEIAIGIVVMLIGVLLAVVDVGFIVLSVIGFCIFQNGINGITQANIKADINGCVRNIEIAEQRKTKNQNKYKDSISALNKRKSEFVTRIAGLESQINETNSKISNCKAYLDLGKDSIVTYWFAEKCSAFGVQQSVDKHIIEQRKAAFGL